VGTRRFAGYTNAPPGAYTYRLRGTNSDGVWATEETAVRLTITPPFWQTWWFITLAAVSVVAAGAGDVAWRFRAVENQRRRLAILVDERTQELQQTLAALQEAKEAAAAPSPPQGEETAVSAFWLQVDASPPNDELSGPGGL
jgi:hypothetical protein